MDFPVGNNVSKPLENQPGDPSRIALNDDANFNLTLGTATMDFEDSMDCGNDHFLVDRMLKETRAQSPVCADFLGKVGGNDSSDIGTAAPRFNDFLDSQVKRNSLNTDDDVTSGVHPGSLCDGETLRYFLHPDAVNSDDTMNFSLLFDDTQRPLVDINTGGNTDVQDHRIGGSMIETGTSRVYGSGMDDPSIWDQSDATTGGNSAGVQTFTQGGTAVLTPQAHNEIRFPSPFSSQTRQTERNSVNSGNNRSYISHTNTEEETTTGTQYVQTARSNNDNSMSVSGQSHNLQSRQINRSSIRSGHKRANAVQSGRPGETRTGRFVARDVTVDGGEDTRLPTLGSNFIGQEINRSSISNEGGLPSRMPVESKDRLMDETFLRSEALACQENHNSMMNRNSTSIAGDMLKVQQSHLPLEVNEGLSYSAISSEQIGNADLNLGFGGLSRPSTFQSNPSHEANGNFLSLGRELGDPTLSSNPHTNSGGNLENPSWPENVQRSSSISKTGDNLQGNAHPNIWRPSGRTSGSRGNGGAMYVNQAPQTTMYVNQVPQTGFHGYPGLIDSIPSGLHANEHVRFPNLAVAPSSLTGFPTRSISATPQQAYMNYVGHTSTNSSMASPIIRPAPRTSRQGQSGNPVLIDDSISEAAKGINLYDNSDQAHIDQGTTRICGRGKRVPADDLQYGQSAKVLLGQSASGKPVPVATPVGLAQTSEGLHGDSIQRINTPNASTVMRAPRGRKVPQSPNSFIPYGNQIKNMPQPPVNQYIPYESQIQNIAQPSLNAFHLRGSSPMNSFIPYENQIRHMPQLPVNRFIPYGSQFQKIAQPSLNASNLPGSQTRRILQSSVDPSKVSGRQAKTIFHIKWGGPRELVRFSGEKCHICKRDLMFAATGPVTQPEVPPAVAVLPCGHTFHDECLQRITPGDQLKDPPCIPCAIGTS